MHLNETKIKAAKPQEKPYKLVDGDGLFLLVQPNGSKYWRCSYRFEGKQKTEAFGVYPTVSLAHARERRWELRQKLVKDIDPAELRKQKKAEDSGALMFESVARAWHASNLRWDPVHRHKILQSLVTYVFPVLGEKDIRKLKTRDLLLPVKKATEDGYLELASRYSSALQQ